MTIDLYGIPNCDTIRKARKWLTEAEIAYSFHNYKKEGVDKTILHQAAEQLGWETLLNRRGTSWRKLDEADREGVDCDKALRLMQENPSCIKRPLLLIDGKPVAVGFDADLYRDLLY
ncbi:MAG: ArsC family reductase [Mariprofundales bacterium]